MKLSPVIQQVATEKGLHLLFSVVDAGMVWADLALDITTEIIQRFDAAAKTACRPAGRLPTAGAQPRGSGRLRLRRSLRPRRRSRDPERTRAHGLPGAGARVPVQGSGFRFSGARGSRSIC